MQIISDNLTFVYSKKSKSLSVKALNGVNLNINEGEFFGIVGETGSGKSTFIQHINGLIKVQKNSGKLVIGDFDLSADKCDYKGLRAKVGMVFQYPEYQLFAETVKDDVLFGIKNFLPNLTEEEQKLCVREAIEKVGLNYEEVKDKSPFDLSGGQKRRVAIAGVIAYKPEVLVLDEPAAGLDPKGKREFLALLKALHQDFVKTIVIVSHDMNLVAEYCTAVAVFKKGKVIKQGTPKEIFNDEGFLLENGLEVPLTAKLTNELSKKGINIDNDLTCDDFIRAVKEYAERKGATK